MKIKKPIFITKFSVAALACVSAGMIVFAVGNASAGSYGTEITKYDGLSPDGSGLYHEDNEAESGMVQSQAWDLEGFFLDTSAKKLTIIGGYDFANGVTVGNQTLRAGDIFIGIDGSTVHSPGTISGFTYTPYQEVANSYFKYDYVLDINWTGGTYNIVNLTGKSMLKDTEYGASNNVASNPWQYLNGGKDANGNALTDTVLGNGTFTVVSLTDDQSGFDGWSGTDGAGNHYAATFNLSSIWNDLSIGTLFHNTMECGNDDLEGLITTAIPHEGVGHAPEPATMLLFGTGLTGIGFVGTWRRKKA